MPLRRYCAWSCAPGGSADSPPQNVKRRCEEQRRPIWGMGTVAHRFRRAFAGMTRRPESSAKAKVIWMNRLNIASKSLSRVSTFASSSLTRLAQISGRLAPASACSRAHSALRRTRRTMHCMFDDARSHCMAGAELPHARMQTLSVSMRASFWRCRRLSVTGTWRLRARIASFAAAAARFRRRRMIGSARTRALAHASLNRVAPLQSSS